MLYRSTTKFFLADVFDAFEMFEQSNAVPINVR